MGCLQQPDRSTRPHLKLSQPLIYQIEYFSLLQAEYVYARAWFKVTALVVLGINCSCLCRFPTLHHGGHSSRVARETDVWHRILVVHPQQSQRALKTCFSKVQNGE